MTRYVRHSENSPLLIAGLSFALTFGALGCKIAKPAATDDATLSAALQSKISGDSALSAEPIQLSVQSGVATLNGAVSSDAARSLAANDAAQVPGVRTVVNNLTVAPAQAAVAPPPPVVKPLPVAPPAKIEKKPAPRQVAKNVPPPPPPAPITRSAPAPLPPPVQPVIQAPPPPAFRSVTLDSGSTIPVRITQTLDSATTQQGDPFSGVVATDVIIDGLVAIPQGTPVTGRVAEVHEAAHFKGSSLLTIELTSINRHGEKIPVTAEQFSKEGTGRGKNTAAKVGGGAAVGAILGGILGGGKGAAIGAASGGALGAGANTVTKGQQVQIPSETLVRFRLTNSIAIKASTRDAAERNPNPDAETGRRQLTPPQ